jgi:hypothetical protein
MNTSTMLIDGAVSPVAGTQVRFSAHQCFRCSADPEVRACLRALGRYLLTLPGLAFYIDGPDFLDELLAEVPQLSSHITCLIAHRPFGGLVRKSRMLVLNPQEISGQVQHIFLAETRMYPRLLMRQRLP